VNIVAGAFLLPLQNPVYVAELTATINVISDGRFHLACGLGYRQEESDVFGVEKSDRVGRLAEGIELIRRLWTEDGVTFDGDHFSVFDVSIKPKPT